MVINMVMVIIMVIIMVMAINTVIIYISLQLLLIPFFVLLTNIVRFHIILIYGNNYGYILWLWL